MNAWLALTKKEFRLGLPAFIVAVLIYAGIIGGGYFLFGLRIGYQEEFLMGSLTTVLVFHLFFMLFYLYFSLSSERKKLHLWLHNPMPVAGLLLSKIVTSFVYMAATFFPLLLITSMLFARHQDILNQQAILNIVLLSTFSIIMFGFFMAVIFLFFWSIYLTLSQRLNDFFSFVITFILFIIIGSIYDYIGHLPIMETLTHWGPIYMTDVLTGFEFSIMENAFETELTTETAIFYMGSFIRDLIIAVLLFLAACWIIDRKVEV